MKRSTVLTIGVLILILCIVGYFAWRAVSNKQVEAPVSAAANALTSSTSAQAFTDIYGNSANLEQHVGDIIVAHAWASWVPTSPRSLRDLAKLQEQYEAQGVTVLAINRGEPTKTAQLFLEQNKVKNVALISDKEDRYFSTSGGRTMPETIFYDSNGDVVFHKRGVMTLEEMKLRTEQTIRASEAN